MVGTCHIALTKHTRLRERAKSCKFEGLSARERAYGKHIAKDDTKNRANNAPSCSIMLQSAVMLSRRRARVLLPFLKSKKGASRELDARASSAQAVKFSSHVLYDIIFHGTLSFAFKDFEHIL